MASCWLGRAGSARSMCGVWKAPAATAPAWSASWLPTASGSWRSTGPTGRPAGGAARATQSTPTPPPGPSRRGSHRHPKAQNGTVEMTRALRVARPTAVKARTQAINAIKALLVTAPAELREQLDSLPTTRLVRQAATLDPGQVATPTAACMLAVRSLAERYQHLGAEIQLLTRELDRLTLQHAPALALSARLRDARLDLPLLGDRRVTARQDREERDHGRNC